MLMWDWYVLIWEMCQVAKGVLLICVPLQVLPGRLRPEYGVQLRVKL